jgi:hypothetical protein
MATITNQSSAKEVEIWLRANRFATEEFTEWDGDALLGATQEILVELLGKNPGLRLYSKLNSLRSTAISLAQAGKLTLT